MNLKEAFRFQNKLQTVLETATRVLRDDQNVTKTTSTYLRKKVMAEAEDETVELAPSTDYADRITDLARFSMFILDEKERLFQAIRKAKSAQAFDIDSETSLNSSRQNLASVFAHMADIRATEAVISNGGVGYRFNADGNQVPYKCDLKRVTEINFNRDKIRNWAKSLNSKSDRVSAEIDRCVVNSEVAYEPPFDVNSSFADIFGEWLEKSKTPAA